MEAAKKATSKKPGPSPVAQDKLTALGMGKISARIAEGETLRSIAADIGVGLGTLSEWLALPENSEQYARAMDLRADRLAEDILSIADDGSNDTYMTENGPAVNHDVIARSRLRVDARKWLASKMAPKKYGEKLAVGGAEDLPPVAVIDPSRPKLTKAEWLALHGVGTAGRPAE